jgi:hypothetical protein
MAARATEIPGRGEIGAHGLLARSGYRRESILRLASSTA